MTEAVLDASAVLAMLQSEPGGEIVEQLLARGPCAISAVNISEVAAKLLERGVPDEVVMEAIASLHLEVHQFESEDAMATARLRAVTRTLGLSLGDRACLALARRLDLDALTTDRRWSDLSIGVSVVVVR